MTLTRLPDPHPPQWLPFPEMMSSPNWYGINHYGVTYGNFWSHLPCRLRPHDWHDLGFPPGEAETNGQYARRVRRCKRCGSQYNGFVAPPSRGKV